MLQYIVILGAAAGFFGTYSYIRDTIKGITQPNRVGWLMWAVAPIIGAIAAWSKGVGWAALPVFMAGFGPLLVVLASWWNPKAYWKSTKFDYLCGLFSILALVMWGITKEPMYAIVFAIISDIFAGIPTLIKGWKYPESETVVAYYTGLFNALTSFFAIKYWVASEIAFPIYLVFMNLSLLFAVTRFRFLRIKF